MLLSSGMLILLIRIASNGKELLMEILRAEDLTKIYGTGENQVVALDHVSFSVNKGEFLAIIGPSGSGKSTLLHILGGVDTPTSGKVYMEGTDVYAQRRNSLPSSADGRSG